MWLYFLNFLEVKEKYFILRLAIKEKLLVSVSFPEEKKNLTQILVYLSNCMKYLFHLASYVLHWVCLFVGWGNYV